MFRVTHNGTDIKFFKKISKVESYIQSVLAEYKDLNPKLVYNYKVGKAIFMCYRYNTLYCEMFLIEGDNDEN